MERFTVNGKRYAVKELDFDYLVNLDKEGISVTNVTGIAAINAFFAYCSGLDEKGAAKEISQHVINGGTLDEIGNAYAKALNDSDFFRSLLESAQKEQEEDEENTEETPKGKKKA